MLSLLSLSLSPKKKNMFIIIGLMFSGIIFGYLLRNIKLLQKLGRFITITILFLLFFLGVSIGANDLIVNNFGTIGLEALLIATATTFGSVLAAWIVYRFVFQDKGGGL